VPRPEGCHGPRCFDPPDDEDASDRDLLFSDDAVPLENRALRWTSDRGERQTTDASAKVSRPTKSQYQVIPFICPLKTTIVDTGLIARETKTTRSPAKERARVLAKVNKRYLK
jgi:hypothetical protein